MEGHDMSNPLNDLVATLITLYEVDPRASHPKSPIYLAFGTDMARYTTVETALLRLQLVLVTAETITLTERGRSTAKKLAGL
jgi:hypothetical protein